MNPKVHIVALALAVRMAVPALAAPPPVAPPAGTLTAQDGGVMLLVPPGTVTMGSADGESDELPVHRVWVDAFYIDRCEVTNRQFRAFVAATGHRGTVEGPDDHPVVKVTWDDATAYCRWADKRLPTEAEWERAARGGDARTYPWGAAAPGAALHGNFADLAARRAGFKGAIVVLYEDGHAGLAPVGSFPKGASPFGALDMAGNVFEWCADFYDSRYYARSPAANPPGPDSGRSVAVRGGSWHNNGFNLRCSNRSRLEPSTRSNRVGFRCARDARSGPPRR